jgi:hypothetical protein
MIHLQDRCRPGKLTTDSGAKKRLTTESQRAQREDKRQLNHKDHKEHKEKKGKE